MVISIGSELTEAEKEKIRAIEWLCFDPKHRAQALIQSNAVARSFIGTSLTTTSDNSQHLNELKLR